MKKIIFCFSLVLTAALIIFACTKETGPETSAFKPVAGSPGSPEKTNACSCQASGFWSSCSISCPMKNGICLANCTTASIWGIGLLGSVATCTCGTASAGKLAVGPEVYFDKINIENLSWFKIRIASETSLSFIKLKTTLDALIVNVNNADGFARADKFNAFIADMEALTYSEASVISPDIQAQATACGRPF